MSHSSDLLPLFPDTAEIRDGVLWVGGCSTVELAEEYGTPLVVYCEETIRAAARAWRRGAGEGTVVYGTKAFPNVPIMRILWEEGIGADVSTLGEMKYAEAAGIPASSWVVHGNNKSDEELAFAAEKDAWLVVMDEPGEVERCVAAGVRRVLLRITPGIEAGGHEKIMTGHLGSKFGVLPEDAVDVIRRARDAGLECSACTCISGRRSWTTRRRECSPRVAGRLVRRAARGARVDARDPQYRRRLGNPLHARRAAAA